MKSNDAICSLVKNAVCLMVKHVELYTVDDYLRRNMPAEVFGANWFEPVLGRGER